MGLFIGNFFENDAEKAQAPLTPEEALRQFIHDMRSPLSAVQTCVYLLKKGITDDNRQAIELLEASTKQIVSSMESERNRTFHNCCSLLQCLSESQKETQATHPKLQVRIISEGITAEGNMSGKNNSPLNINADIRILRRIISNLINNSAEAHASEVLFRVREDLATGLVTLKVEDNGCGIPSELLPLVGKRTYSFGEKSAGSGSGSGLGLSQVREQMRQWNGRFEITSQILRGTTVGLSFQRT